jgi:hypothetical protein
VITKTFLRNCFVVCVTRRPDLFPTGYYAPSGELVIGKDNAATFCELDEVLKFVEDQEIKLGENCYIQLLI